MATTNSAGFDHYLRSVRHPERLTREDEYELSRRSRKGDQAARRALAEAFLPFVVALARQFASQTMHLDDLVQEGNVGLMKAIEHFDAKRNVRFATYAVWWIRAYIMRSVKDNRSQVRGGDRERIRMADFSLDDQPNEDSDTYLEMLEDDSTPLDTVCGNVERDAQVSEALGRVHKRLGELGWAIVQERLTQDVPVTLETLGSRWSVSRERVRQVELKLRAFLQRHLAAFDPTDGLAS